MSKFFPGRCSNNSHVEIFKKFLKKSFNRTGYIHRHLAYLKSLYAHKCIQLQDSLITLLYFKRIMGEIQTTWVFFYKPKLAHDKLVVITSGLLAVKHI